MRTIFKIVCLLLGSTYSYSQYISEIHYDNIGNDVNESVEVFIPIEVEFKSIDIQLINGSNGLVYKKGELEDFDRYISSDNKGTFWVWETKGIQQGPDGIALIIDDKLIEFISYEGKFIGKESLIDGIESIDIGISQNASTLIGSSIGKIGEEWKSLKIETFGYLNNGIPEGSITANDTFFFEHKTFFEQNVNWQIECSQKFDEITNVKWYDQDFVPLHTGFTFNPTENQNFKIKEPKQYLFYAICEGRQNGLKVWSEPALIDFEWLSPLNYNSTCPVYIELIDYKNEGWKQANILLRGHQNESFKLDKEDRLHRFIAWNPNQSSELVFNNPNNESGIELRIWDYNKNLLWSHGGKKETAVSTTYKWDGKCIENCQNTEKFTLGIVTGDGREAISWEIRNSKGERLYYKNTGFYAGKPKGDTLTEVLQLPTCEPLQMTISDALGNGWKSGSWFLNNERVLITQQNESFAFTTSQIFTLPCEDSFQNEEEVLKIDLCDTVDYEFSFPNNKNCKGYEEVNTWKIWDSKNNLIFQSNETDNQSIKLPIGKHVFREEISFEQTRLTRKRTIKLTPKETVFVCNDQVQVSMNNENCDFELSLDDVLERGLTCDFDYKIVVDKDEYVIQVAGEDYCGGEIILLDNTPPSVSVQNYELSCNHPHALNEKYSGRYRVQIGDLPIEIPSGTKANPVSQVFDFSTLECVPLGEIIKEFTLSINLNHTDIEDLEIRLKNDVDEITLIPFGTCLNKGAQDINVRFSSSAEVPIAEACRSFIPSINGVFQPQEDITFLEGMRLDSLAKNWQLVITDNDKNSFEGIGEGQLNFANIRIQTQFPEPFIIADCDDNIITNLETEVVKRIDCDSSIGAIIERNYLIEDPSGNGINKSHITTLLKPTFDEILLPNKNVELSTQDAPQSHNLRLIQTGIPQFNCFDLDIDEATFCEFVISYEDREAPLCGQGYIIFREWTFLHSCSNEIKHFVQNIRVNDNSIPDENIAHEQVLPMKDCKYSLTFQKPNLSYQHFVVDSATQQIYDLNKIQTIENLPLGEHIFYTETKNDCDFTVFDTIRVRIDDENIPIAICDDTLKISLNGENEVQIFARDIDEGSYDDCSEVKTFIRLSKNESWSEYVVVSCSNNEPDFEIELRVIDEFGNENTCYSVCQITNYYDSCSEKINISGRIAFEETPLPNVAVIINEKSFLTNETGQFSFSNLEVGIPHRLKITKTDERIKGISVTDVVMIINHILGKEEFDDDKIKLRADINGDGKISVQDVVSLRKGILTGEINEKGFNPWRFLEDSEYYHFQKEVLSNEFLIKNSTNNFSIEPHKIGDVNHSYFNPISENRANENQSVFLRDTIIDKQKYWSFSVSKTKNIAALDLVFPQRTVFKNGQITISKDEIHSENGIQKILWLNTINKSIEEDKPLFFIEKVASRLLKGELYFDDLEMRKIEFKEISIKESVSLAPNPFFQQTQVIFDSDVSQELDLKVYSIDGKLITNQHLEIIKGRNTIPVQLSEKGVFFLHIQTESKSDVFKILSE